jgi:hypothetical protein
MRYGKIRLQKEAAVLKDIIIKRLIMTICTFGISIIYALPYYLPGESYPMYIKPYIYRHLSLWGIELLQKTGMNYETASIVFIGFSGVFFAFSLIYLLTIMRQDKPELYALIFLSIFIILFQRYLKPYDLLTAAFFTLAIGLLAQRRLKEYLFVFFLSSLNRETTILLLPIFMILYWDWFSPKIYALYIVLQVAIFSVIQIGLHYLFRESSGDPLRFAPLDNINSMIINYRLLIISFLFVFAIGMLIQRNWRHSPGFLKTSFLVLMPALFILYICCGYAFEYRVFAEVYPIVALLAVRI